MSTQASINAPRRPGEHDLYMSFDLPPGMPVVVTPPHFAFGIGIINCANPVIGKLVRMRSKLIDAYGGSTFYETRDLCAYETCVPHHPLVKGA